MNTSKTDTKMDEYEKAQGRAEELGHRALGKMLFAYEAGEHCRDLLRNALGSYGFRELEEYAAACKYRDAVLEEIIHN
jgi:hypothetical protein